MQAVRDYPSAIAKLAGPMGLQPNRERWLAVAAERAGLPLRTIRGLFYGEVVDPKTSVTDAIEAALNAANDERSKAARDEIDGLRKELASLKALVAAAITGGGGASGMGDRRIDAGAVLGALLDR